MELAVIVIFALAGLVGCLLVFIFVKISLIIRKDMKQANEKFLEQQEEFEEKEKWEQQIKHFKRMEDSETNLRRRRQKEDF